MPEPSDTTSIVDESELQSISDIALELGDLVDENDDDDDDDETKARNKKLI
eukprot:CAMPEP_0118709810 /NCGR_PEP_ID=MMETSP0800-20121206/22920_1 /TAXON_ID=210618 ORGANISM="Striatella unipunctata, Strain CCMP2910" /NCGR_SAMPLE_ID=MMETSP0800 /ASSEMBLY_ACC=CAM_ASM_000638 /LENGTH=50 /DNA_ID=CAMNT_0006613697 /DNA_START=122 /DNA_END=271 /DNA_ORIENTATION=-